MLLIKAQRTQCSPTEDARRLYAAPHARGFALDDGVSDERVVGVARERGERALVLAPRHVHLPVLNVAQQWTLCRGLRKCILLRVHK